MGAILDIDALTALNPKESTEFQEFIAELTYQSPELKSLHKFFGGVKMKEQIVLVGQMGKTGIKGTGCARVTSGAGAIATEKFWEPTAIEDTFEFCAADLNALFKAYFDKIQSYIEKFDIQGSELETFIAILIENAMKRTVQRAIWLGDKDVAEAEATTSGLAVAGNAKFYNYIDGIWAQIFAEEGRVEKVTIDANALGTIALQETLEDGFADELFESMWAKADPRLKGSTDAKFYVSGGIWENYRKYLKSKGENFTIEYTVEGFQELKWAGRVVVNMETVWDVDIKADFVANTTDNTYYLPNRAILTTPSNIPYASLNENDFTELETWYNRDDRVYKMAVGFTIDAKFLENYLAVVAY